MKWDVIFGDLVQVNLFQKHLFLHHMTKDCHILSYCGLVDARISASEKDLPVQGPGIILLKIRLKNSLTFRQNIE